MYQFYRIFYFRVFQVSSHIKKKIIFDRIFDSIECGLVITETKQDCVQNFSIHDVVIRLKVEVLKICLLI